MALNIQRGRVAKAQKIVLYGPEGVGKTTFAAQFPDPIFIDTEGGTEHYDVARISPAPKSWNELMATVDAVKREKPCKTLVIDTADWAENLCSLHVCSINSYKSIEDPGYGAGYTKLREEFGKLLDKLSDVAEAGIHVVVTAHAMMRKFDQPDEMASYDRWELKLQKKVAAIIKEWADAILFANYKTIVTTVDRAWARVRARRKGRSASCTANTTHAGTQRTAGGCPTRCRSSTRRSHRLLQHASLVRNQRRCRSQHRQLRRRRHKRPCLLRRLPPRQPNHSLNPSPSRASCTARTGPWSATPRQPLRRICRTTSRLSCS